jgi:hypothetical protein
MPTDWADFDSSGDDIEPFIDRADGGEGAEGADPDVAEIDVTEIDVVDADGEGSDGADGTSVELGATPMEATREPAPVPVPDRGRADVSDDVPAVPRDALAHVESILDQVEQALSRLDDGTYGLCLTCGFFIDDDILAADPTAQACSACASVSA